jgi:hypothetical protein
MAIINYLYRDDLLIIVSSGKCRSSSSTAVYWQHERVHGIALLFINDYRYKAADLNSVDTSCILSLFCKGAFSYTECSARISKVMLYLLDFSVQSF